MSTSECPKCRGGEHLRPCDYCGASRRDPRVTTCAIHGPRDFPGPCPFCASSAESEALLLCRRAVEAAQAFIECGQQPTLDPGGSGEYRRARRDMEQAHAAAVAALEALEEAK